MLKPEAITMGLIGEVLRRIIGKGLKITAMKLIRASKEEIEELYDMHRDKPFYEKLIKTIASMPILVMVVEGSDAVKVMRQLAGATDPSEAAKGTIRGDYGLNVTQNIVHTADGIENASREIRIFFKRDDVLEY